MSSSNKHFQSGNLAGTLSHNLGMVVCGDFNDANWQAYVAWWRDELGPTLSERRGCFLVFAPTNGPTPKQRAALSGDPQIAHYMKAVKKLALVTDSSVIRGAVTAMNWLSGAGRTHRTFRVRDLRLALQWLGDDVVDDREAMQNLVRLCALVGCDLSLMDLGLAG